MTSANAKLPARTDSSEEEIGYINRIFVQALFPYRASDDYRRVITQGPSEVILTSPNGLPYGKYPRLIMAYIVTTAMQRAYLVKLGKLTADQARVIPLGDSLNQFLQNIGTSGRATGGKTGNSPRVKDQLRRLVSSTITVQKRWADKEDGAVQPLAESWTFWSNPGSGALKDGQVRLTADFFAMICDNPIPINLTTLYSLNKPRAIDLYIWLTLKQYWLHKRGLDTHSFDWQEVEHQFSVKELTTAVQRRDFRNEIKDCIKQINALWPDSGATVDTKDGLTIEKKKPSVPMVPAQMKLL